MNAPITHRHPYPPSLKDLFGRHDMLEWTATERKGRIGMTYRLLPAKNRPTLKSKRLTHQQFLRACEHVVFYNSKVVP